MRWGSNLVYSHPSHQSCCHAQDFEAELKKYMAVEQRIAAVPAVRNIGALSLETQPLKAALRAEAASWKAQFARNLHKQSAEDLRVRRVCYAQKVTLAQHIQVASMTHHATLCRSCVLSPLWFLCQQDKTLFTCLDGLLRSSRLACWRVRRCLMLGCETLL